MPVPNAAAAQKVDFLIVTALQDEFNILVSLLDAQPSYEEIPDAITYVSRVGSKGQYKVAIIISGQTNAVAQAAVSAAIQRRDPRAVILTGIAAGFPESGVEFGDVMVPFWIAPYEHARITEEGTEGAKVTYQHRDSPLDVTISLWEAAALLKNDPDRPWMKDLHVARPASPREFSQVHASRRVKIGSGDKLVATEFAEAREWLLSQFGSDALGLEMESYGVCVACRSGHRPAFLVVKASQDPGTKVKDDKASKDEWRRYAAAVAARFVLTLIARYDLAEFAPARPAPAWHEDELIVWNEYGSTEQAAIGDSECAWVLRYPRPGRSPLDVELVYDAESVRYQRYDSVVKSIPLLQRALQEWQEANPHDWELLSGEAWGRQVRLEGVQVKRSHESHVDEIRLSPSKFLYYLAIHQKLAEPHLSELRRHVVANAFELRDPLWLPSNFAIHMGVVSADGFLLLRRRQGGKRTPYSGAWEAGIGEFMHGPMSPFESDLPDLERPTLEPFLKRAVGEELGYAGARITDFTLHGFALERRTLAPKLLVVYRSDAPIETLMEGATRVTTEDYAYEVDKIRLTPNAVAAVSCDSSYPTWGPTSKLTMMLALTADLKPDASRNVIRKIQDRVQALRANKP